MNLLDATSPEFLALRSEFEAALRKDCEDSGYDPDELCDFRPHPDYAYAYANIIMHATWTGWRLAKLGTTKHLSIESLQ